MNDKAPSRHAQQVTAYVQYLAQQKQMSAHTVQSYQRYVRCLAEMVAAADLSWQTLEQSHIKGFIRDLRYKNLKPTTISAYLSAWRQFYQWLIHIKHVQTNPIQGHQSP